MILKGPGSCYLCWRLHRVCIAKGVSECLYRPCKFEHNIAMTASLDNFVPLVQVAERVPSLEIVVEREGLLHAFCCTLEGSSWIATQIPHLCN
jgi:hypothetical protein